MIFFAWICKKCTCYNLLSSLFAFIYFAKPATFFFPDSTAARHSSQGILRDHNTFFRETILLPFVFVGENALTKKRKSIFLRLTVQKSKRRIFSWADQRNFTGNLARRGFWSYLFFSLWLPGSAAPRSALAIRDALTTFFPPPPLVLIFKLASRAFPGNRKISWIVSALNGLGNELENWAFFSKKSLKKARLWHLFICWKSFIFKFMICKES